MTTFKFNTPAEAYAAIMWLVCTADGSGTMEERSYLFDHVQGLDIFRDLSLVEFQKLLGTAFIRLFPTYPHGRLSLTDEGSGGLAARIREALTPELRVEAWNMAVGLANSDGLCVAEETLLDQLRWALELDDQATYLEPSPQSPTKSRWAIGSSAIAS